MQRTHAWPCTHACRYQHACLRGAAALPTATRHALPPGYVLKSQMKELLAEEAAKNARDMTEVCLSGGQWAKAARLWCAAAAVIVSGFFQHRLCGRPCAHYKARSALLAAPAPARAQVIEEERAKVDAKTPVTEDTFRAWHAKKAEQRRNAREEVEAERRKKGVLNGREIFMQARHDAGGGWGAGVEGCRSG